MRNTISILSMAGLLAGCMPSPAQQVESATNSTYYKYQAELQAATKDAVIKCSNKKQCDKLWSLTQLYINNNSGMKIQLSNDTIIETYNPTQSNTYGFDATKTPGAGETATINLTYKCYGLDNPLLLQYQNYSCMTVGVKLLKSYATEMKAHMKN